MEIPKLPNDIIIDIINLSYKSYEYKLLDEIDEMFLRYDYYSCYTEVKPKNKELCQKIKFFLIYSILRGKTKINKNDERFIYKDRFNNYKLDNDFYDIIYQNFYIYNLNKQLETIIYDLKKILIPYFEHYRDRNFRIKEKFNFDNIINKYQFQLREYLIPYLIHSFYINDKLYQYDFITLTNFYPAYEDISEEYYSNPKYTLEYIKNNYYYKNLDWEKALSDDFISDDEIRNILEFYKMY